jgi:CSLREA domain-containing protein
MTGGITTRAAAVAAVLLAGTAARADTFVVTNTVDPGNGTCDAGCTLREAIDAANANPGTDLIHFDIPGSGPHVIHPLTPLPEITDPVSFDGRTQPGFAGLPLIEIAGDLAGVDTDGLTISAPFCQVGWIAITRFDGEGIMITDTGSGAKIVGCHLGVDPTGTIALGNGGRGVRVEGPDNEIGGTTSSQRNIISGNVGYGITVVGPAAAGNVIEGNYIGLDRTGTVAVPNDGGGVNINVNAHANRIGGTAPGAGNVIAGNDGLGIMLIDAVGAPAGNHVVEGNLIGTDASGTVVMPNFRGIYVASPGNTIGGWISGAGNTIAGGYDGIFVGGSAHGTTIQGNRVGTDVTGTAPLPNELGVRINADGCTIGGTGSVQPNVIAFNLGVGLEVAGGTGNEIAVNSIHSNGGLGVDLGADGVTPNDPLDADTGPNDLQNCPEVVAAVRGPDATQIAITFVLDSKPSNWYRVRSFASGACDPSGAGEGERALGSSLVLTDASGHFSGTHTFAATVALDEVVTATAMDFTTFDTSEFSPCREITAVCPEDCAGTGDGSIDVTDLLEVLADWGGSGPCDTDDSGAIDVTDLLAILADWGSCL